jgi:hypothetical protein
MTTSLTAAPATVDNRAVRFGAGITATVTALAFLTAGSATSTLLLAFQTSVFAAVVVGGFGYSLYGAIFRTVIRQRLSSSANPEPVEPARFAQTVGLICAGTALLASLSGSFVLAATFAGITFVASFLNAAFNFCLGCEMYALALKLKK